jgi:hypothetical protein
VTHIKKTNGYEEDGHYRVEFTYDIELKDPDTLKRMRQTYQEERDRVKAWEDAGKADQQQIATLKTEILALRKEHNSSPPSRRLQLQQSTGNGFPGRRRISESADPVGKRASAAKQPAPEDAGARCDGAGSTAKARARPAHEHHLQQGDRQRLVHVRCRMPEWRLHQFLYPALLQIRNDAAKAQDVLYWLQDQQLQMKGKITMRKTENGWRALSEG